MGTRRAQMFGPSFFTSSEGLNDTKIPHSYSGQEIAAIVTGSIIHQRRDAQCVRNGDAMI